MTEFGTYAHLQFRASTFIFQRRSTGPAALVRDPARHSAGVLPHGASVSRLAELTTSVVKWFQLEGSLDYGFRLIQPILVKVTSHSDGTRIVTDDFSSVFGAGDSLEAAILDYRQSLAESFEILVDDYESLGPNLRSELKRLAAYVSQVDNAS